MRLREERAESYAAGVEAGYSAKKAATKGGRRGRREEGRSVTVRFDGPVVTFPAGTADAATWRRISAASSNVARRAWSGVSSRSPPSENAGQSPPTHPAAPIIRS